MTRGGCLKGSAFQTPPETDGGTETVVPARSQVCRALRTENARRPRQSSAIPGNLARLVAMEEERSDSGSSSPGQGESFTFNVSREILQHVKDNLLAEERKQDRLTRGRAAEPTFDLGIRTTFGLGKDDPPVSSMREWARERASRPVFSSVEPPPGAKTYYKIVCVPASSSTAPDGVGAKEEEVLPCTCFSVYDGETEYRKGLTLFSEAKAGHAGGFYVYDTVEECLVNHEHFPRASRGTKDAEWRKAVARVVAWNTSPASGERLGRDGEGDARSSSGKGRGGDHHEEIRYGSKKVFSYVRLVDILPFPAGDRKLPSERVTGPASKRRLQVIRARARTIALKEEVDRMEEKLRVSRLMAATEGPLGLPFREAA